MKNVFDRLWDRIEEFYPEGRPEADGAVLLPSPGLYDWEVIIHNKQPMLVFTLRTCYAYPIWKVRRYLDYLLSEIGGFLSYEISIYSEDSPPCNRGRRRSDFDTIDLTVFIS